ncbi:hypothetical protein AK830_g11667 [Neonectria ditissima]|uniref:Uncharacterized protein n=1 Tax=Neonectria ditissima TaxID=78410 RepID=A0A0P7B4N3_9HYPO|nr:hypothetical protein AK830_g11667 [Neonectria ditissima]
MTYSSSGPSLAQAPDVDPSSDSSSSSSWTSSGSHSHSHSHSHSNSHARSSSAKRHAHLHRRDSHQVNPNANDDDSQDDQLQHQDEHRSFDTGTRLRHSHRRLQNRETQNALKLDIRQEDTTGYVTQVVQTVSVVQVVDSVGSPIELQTLYGDPNTVVVDSASGSTISVSNPEPSSSEAAPASNPASTNNVAQSSADMTPLQASTPAAETTSISDSLVSTTGATSVSATTDSVTDSASSLSETSVATASSYSVALDSLQDSSLTPVPTVESAYNGSLNGTSTTPTIESTTSTSSQTTLTETSPIVTSDSTTLTSSDVTSTATSDSSLLKDILSTTSNTRSLTSSSVSSSSSTTTATETTTDLSSTILSSTIYSVSTETWTSTQYDDDGSSSGSYGDGTAVDQPTDPTITSTSSDSSGDSSGSTLSTQQKQVIGGVVGSIAGVAFLAILFLLAFKYKKKHGNRSLLGDNAAGTNAKRLITGGNSGGGSGGAMTERTGPFAVAAALAGLTGKRSNQTPPPDPDAGGERGFYRVSGKKLPSVLQTGGDGYSDPRESVASGHTDYWRGSQAFNPSEGGSNRLALGSPMRPVSGVPIIRTGPARTPIKEVNPFVDSNSPSRPRPDSDALGGSIGNGSIASQDGSYGSPSRFQERI